VNVDDLIATAAVARRHYLDGRTKVQIADEFGISRFKVTRLLNEALEQGVVTISVSLPENVNIELAARLRRRFGLKRVVVVESPDDSPEAVRNSIGQAAARILMDSIHDGDVVGIANGRTINATTQHITSLARCDVVQLTGMALSVEADSVELVRRVSAISGGTPHAIYAPLTVATEATASALRADPNIMQAIELFPKVTIAVVAVGSWEPADSQLFLSLTPAERETLLARDVCADVAGGLLDSQGRSMDDLADRTIGMSLEELRAIPQLMVIGGGVRKVNAIHAVLKSQLASILVTDVRVACDILKSAEAHANQ
jgi:DNA-binding transcriptional regulator LsrR (DeoR family)